MWCTFTSVLLCVAPPAFSACRATPVHPCIDLCQVCLLFTFCCSSILIFFGHRHGVPSSVTILYGERKTSASCSVPSCGCRGHCLSRPGLAASAAPLHGRIWLWRTHRVCNCEQAGRDTRRSLPCSRHGTACSVKCSFVDICSTELGMLTLPLYGLQCRCSMARYGA